MAKDFEQIFERGVENPLGQYFKGQSYLATLNEEGLTVYNVTFEPGCINNWHIHHASTGGGQMLIVTAGKGWYQAWGEPAVELVPGKVVFIAPGVKHWHGAAKDSWLEHVTFEVPGTDTSNEWLEPVDQEAYNAL
jgi:quercetin dioxygenase-like cupin family protein